MPSFWRKADTPAASAYIGTTVASVPTPSSAAVVRDPAHVPSSASAPQLLLLIDEDDGVSPEEVSLMPRKRRAIDAGGERPIVIDLEEGNFVLRETAIVYVGENASVGSEVPHVEEINMNPTMHPAEETVEDGTHDDGLALPR